METFNQLLIKLNACEDARKWAGDMPIEEVVKNCHRGDWLLWLAKRIDIDARKLTLAKGHCANTVRYLMVDERSVKAVDTAIAYGNGEIDDIELSACAAAAYAASYAANAAYADAADADAAYADAAAAYAAAYAAANAADAADAARIKNQAQTADICREIIGHLIIERVNNLLKDNK